MARNRCKLTDEGLKAVDALLKALGNDSFPGIRKIQNFTGLDRETISHIYNRDKAVSYNSLEKLFQGLNSQAHFEKFPSQRKDFCDEYYYEVEEPAEPRDSSSSNQNARTDDTLSDEAKLIKALWNLDCEEQEEALLKCLKKLDRGGMFLVKAQGLPVQRWLVKRLAEQISKTNSDSEILPPIEVTRQCQPHFRSWVEGALWKEFRNKETPPSSVQEAINYLCNLAKDVPVVMTLFGFERLESNIQTHLLEFWKDLQSSFNKAKDKGIRSKIVFFLVDGEGISDVVDPRFEPYQRDPTPDQAFTPDQAIALPPLVEIPKEDLRYWLRQEIPQQLLSQKISSCEKVKTLIEEDRLWRSSPQFLLDEVCFTLHNSTGLAAFESYWKLDKE